ncbi:hypothetical protein [Ramlibacter sp.]|uniref:hypothetical protein n=1 Tax=Ramlibacter sp. TaxID=1917967 RepID=UPI002D3AA796|nr:hypothetical protein [Ramlibacter sp.]HYD76979.1 hypothetical protein [Ramlibacter sp.]
MSCARRVPRLHPWLALSAAMLLPCAGAWAQDAHALAPVAPSGVVMRPAPGLQIQYEPLSAEGGQPVAGRLDGALETGAGKLRAGLRIDPSSGARLDWLDANWEAQVPGPLHTLVLGETQGSGGGWSQNVPLTGLRFGRPLALRAPSWADDVFLPGLAFAGTAAPQHGFGDAAGTALQDTRTLLGTGALPTDTPLRGPELLAPGATDYEVALGRVRDQDAGYAAGGWRLGLAPGLTAEARTEWMPSRLAHGVEVVQSAAGGMLQAVLAQSADAAGSGLRWGMGFVRSEDGMRWNLAWDAAERGYTTVAGGGEPRSALRAGTRWELGRRLTADLSYTRSRAWEAEAADAAWRFAAAVPLARRASLSLGLALREGPQAGWNAAMTLSVPLAP